MSMMTTLEASIKQDESDYQVLSTYETLEIREVVRRVKEMLVAYQAMGCDTAEVRVILIPRSSEGEK